MIRRHPQRPLRRQHQDFHFFAASDPIANIESQFARQPQVAQPPAPATTPMLDPGVPMRTAVTSAPSEHEASEQRESNGAISATSLPPNAALPAEASLRGEAGQPNAADVIHRAAEYLANIDDPRELLGQPRPPFMDEIEALAATRPKGRAHLAKNPTHSKLRARKSPRSPGQQNRTKANPSEASFSRSHHERHCTICSHPDRDEIEAEFIEWTAPDDIASEYEVNRRAVYRHARAAGLFARRNGNLRFALGRLIQRVDCVEPTADSIVRAIHAFARINDDGQWVEPPAHVIVSSGGIRRETAAGGHRPVAISLDSPALPNVIDVPPTPELPAIPHVAELPVTASRVETDATR